MYVIDLHVRVSEMVGSCSERTQDRLRTKGRKGFLVKQWEHNHVGWNPPREAVLLMSVDDYEAGRDPWLGWIPTQEVDIRPWK